MLAYVDGSNKGDGSAFSWGVIAFMDGEKYNLSGNSDDEKLIRYRNIAGELFASVNAVKFAIRNKASKVYIYHDYSGIRHWALAEWKRRNELSRHYRSFFEKALKKIEIAFVKVDGHTGDRFNEEVDILAKRELGID